LENIIDTSNRFSAAKNSKQKTLQKQEVLSDWIFFLEIELNDGRYQR
jgi:hypothetical protein